jgi:hypothetical protein
MANFIYPGSNRSIRYRDPNSKVDLEQYPNRTEKVNQLQIVNRKGKGDQLQRVNREGKGDQPQRVNRAEKGNPVRGAKIPKPKLKPVNPNASTTPKKKVEKRKPMVPKPTARPSVSPKAETFAQATRRGTSDEYLRNKLKPKSNLLSLIRGKKKG